MAEEETLGGKGTVDMPWARFDDEFDDDPELDLIGPVAACLFLCSITWCNRNLTDGFLPKARASKLTGGTPESVAALLQYGWWSVEADGYRVRNFLKYNLSAEQVATERERANDRQKRYLDKKRGKGGKSYNAVNNAVKDGVNNNDNNAVNDGVCDVSDITNTVNDAGSRIPSPESEESGEENHASSEHEAGNGAGEGGVKPKRKKSSPTHRPDDFELCYAAYGKAIERVEAVEEWDKYRPSVEEIDAILAFIALAKNSDRWRRGYKPSFGRFVKDQRWTDSLSEYADIPRPQFGAPSQTLELRSREYKPNRGAA